MQGKNRNILYHLRTQGTGSEGIHIRGIVNAFRKKGYTVDFLWPLGEGDPTVRAGNNPYDRKKSKSKLEVIVPMIPGPVFAFLEFLYNFWAYRNFKSLVKNKKYLFIYERHYFFSIASGLIARRFNIPLVVEINELAGFKRVRKNHLTRLAMWCERSLFKNATLISVVSKHIRDEILRRYKEVSPEKVHVIPNGVEESYFDENFNGNAIRERFGVQDKIVFGFVGFFLHEKSWHKLEWFLPVFLEATEGMDDVAIMLVGDGPGRKGLEEIAKEHNAEERVIFTGSVPNSEVGHYLKAMDIGVIPHTNEYRSPIKMFEYMALGKPILAPDAEPVVSVIGGIQRDYLFETESEDSLKKTILHILATRNKWQEIGEKLNKLTREKYTYEKHGETILNLMEPFIEKAET